MAGRKKKFEEPLSKTARASANKGKKKDEGFQASGDLNRIISLAGGEFAYLLDPRNGLTHHLRVDSGSWMILIQELLETVHGPKIQAELDKLGWKVHSVECYVNDDPRFSNHVCPDTETA